MITVVGLGPGPLKYLTAEAREVLISARRVLFRYREHPAYEWLVAQGRSPVAMGKGYYIPHLTHDQLYEMFLAFVVQEEERHGSACYAVPGNPGVLEETAVQLRQRGARIVAGMSFLDQIYAELGLDPAGMQIVLPRTHVKAGRFTTSLPMMICQAKMLSEKEGAPADFTRTAKYLLRSYSSSHPLTVIWTAGMPDYELRTRDIELGELAAFPPDGAFQASVYVHG